MGITWASAHENPGVLPALLPFGARLRQTTHNEFNSGPVYEQQRIVTEGKKRQF